MKPGEQWEHDLDTQHGVYALQKRAELVKTAPPFRVLSARGQGFFSGQFTGKGRVDFVGGIVGVGPAFIEAKTTQFPRWPFSSFKPEQIDYLDGIRVGVRGVVVRWEYGTPWRSVWLGWDVLGPALRAWRFERGPASLTVDEALALGGVEMRGADWLSAMERA